MGIEDVRRFFAERGVTEPIIEFEQSSATVDLSLIHIFVVPSHEHHTRTRISIGVSDDGTTQLCIIPRLGIVTRVIPAEDHVV